MTEAKNSLRDGANALLSIGAMLAKIGSDMRAAGLDMATATPDEQDQVADFVKAKMIAQKWKNTARENEQSATRWEAVARENQKRADEAERLLKSQSDLEERLDKVRKQRDTLQTKLVASTPFDQNAYHWRAAADRLEKQNEQLRQSNENWEKVTATLRDQLTTAQKERDVLRVQRDEQLNKRRVTAERSQEWANEADRLQAELTLETKALVATRSMLDNVSEALAVVTKDRNAAQKKLDELRDHLQEPRSAGFGEVVVPISRVTEYAYDTQSPERNHVRLFIDAQRDSWLHNAVRKQESL